MTNRQSNIIFYTIILVVISGFIVNSYYPQYFEYMAKGQPQLAIDEALDKQEYEKALAIYSELIIEHASRGEANTEQVALMYEAVAKIYLLQGNQLQAQRYFLKALPIRQQRQERDRYSLAQLYHVLGELAVDLNRRDQGQVYFEQSLQARLASAQQADSDSGMFTQMQQTRINYKRLNHPETIATFEQLAKLHLSQQDYQTAKNYYQKALQASINTFGEDSAEVASIADSIKQLEP